ncbi:peptidoglycan-binding protein [Hirschia maritima]|uniref:peptidoglycan-binding protein n=1 Tax=Hirschia maritima TaxID=1121961 RepID=UPI000361ED8F|nr:peptidoglycan-binding protein [Hirschia maritima]
MGHAPWSVKGIDPKARAKAREHAQRDGITLGSYLNRLLLEDSGSKDEPSNSPLNPILRGEAQPERVSEVANTLEEISRRMNAGENRSTQALAGVDQSMLTLLNRLESNERSTAGIANRFDGALNDMRATQASLEERLDSVSRKDNSRRMLDAMRALEGALTKLAKQVHDTKDEVAEDQDNLRNELSRGVTHLSNEVDGISRRMDDAVTNATNRIDRDVKDRFGSIENRLNESNRKSDDTSSRLDRFERSTEDRLRDALGRTENALDLARTQSRKAEERFNTIEDKISDTQRKADSALQTSQNSFNDLRDSLKSFASHTDNKLDEALSTADAALSASKQSSADIAEEVAKRNKELSDKLFGSINDVEERINTAQQNVTSMFAKVSDVDARIEKTARSTQNSDEALATLQAAVERINERFTEAETNKVSAISDLEKSYSSLDERLEEVQQKVGESTDIRKEFEEKLSEIASDFSKTIEDTNSAVDQRIEAATKGVEAGAVDALQKQIDSMQSDIAAAEERQLNAVELISGQFERLSEALDQRLQGVEDRGASDGAVEDLREELERTTSLISERLNAVEETKSSQMGTLAEQVGKIAAHMEERLEETNAKIDDTERRSAEAIEQVGEHVARATERLQARNEEAFENINNKIDEVSSSTRQHLSSTMEEIEQRLKAAREEAAHIVSPVQNTVSSLAQKVDNLSATEIISDDEDLATDIAPPPLPQSEQEDIFATDDGIVDDFIEPQQQETDETPSLLDEFVEDIVSPPVFETETPAEEDIDVSEVQSDEEEINDSDIADIAFNARKEFAAELAEQRAELEAEAELFKQNDEAIAEIINKADGPQIDESVEDSLFESDAETDAFTSSLELEYETELPAENAFNPRRSDVGLDDDPFARASTNNSEFLVGARQAAKERGADNRIKLKSADDRKNGKLPMVAAGVLAAAVVGGAGMVAMRGKHVSADDGMSVTPPKFNPDATQAGATNEDEDTLFDAKEEAAELHTSNERGQQMGNANAHVDEQVLFPEDARILTSENFKAAETTSGVVEAGSIETPKRVSALDAFASSRSTPPETSAAPQEPKISLEAAAENGSAIAQHELAIKQLASGEKRVAAETMRKAADQGLAAAQYRMGKLYERGEGVPRSIKESRKWTTLAAENGNVKAMHDLAVFYAEGEGGDQSFLAGVEWFTRAADYGLIDSQYNLGVLYEQGLGVSQDLAKAAYWFEISGKNGDADGNRRARDILNKLPTAEANKISAEANAFSPRQVSGAANGKFGQQPWSASLKTQISEVQSLLAQISGASLTADGVMGPNTRNAIREFERSNGLIPTGEVSEALLRKLRSAARNGS